MSSKPTAISFGALNVPDKGVVVILAGEGGTLSPIGKALDKAGKGIISQAAKINGFKGAKKSVLDLMVPSGLGLARLLVVGTGKPGDFSETDWLEFGGFIRAKLSGQQSPQATIIVEPFSAKQKLPDSVAANIAAGSVLANYKFLKYKTKSGKSEAGNNGPDKDKDDQQNDLKKIVVHCANPAASRKDFASLNAICNGVNFARDLVNEPANILDPAEFAKRLKALSRTGLKVTILDDKELKKLKMGSFLCVGQGSPKPSYVVLMEWNGAGAKGGEPVAIVGKGVCFDTGGISIKPSMGMEDMKGDMAGAACVAGLMMALAERKAKVNVVGAVGLVENMPSGTATRPGDIVTSMSGQTIEVLNTDAEGRLVLADVLWYVQEKFKPKWIVNLATLTGAILVALGKEHAGLFSNNDDLSENLAKAGEATREKVWRLPLGPKYDDMLKSKTADMKNIGGRYAGSITAAQFLQRFIKKDVPWAHLDIAGTGMGSPSSDINKSWGSGFGVRLLNRLIADTEEK